MPDVLGAQVQVGILFPQRQITLMEYQSPSSMLLEGLGDRESFSLGNPNSENDLDHWVG